MAFIGIFGLILPSNAIFRYLESRRGAYEGGESILAILAPWFFLIAVGVGPDIVTDSVLVSQRVDLIELNHFIDQEGREVFRQVLFYDWSNEHRRHVVRAWRLVKSESQLPRRHWFPAQFQCVWHDEGLLRQVSAPAYRETWTQHDPERENRKLIAENDRVPLTEPRIASEPTTATLNR